MQKMFGSFFAQQAAFYGSIAKQMADLATMFNGSK
jgi:hypothetical protein